MSSVCSLSSRFSPACTAASGPRSCSSRRACWTYQSLRWSCIATSSDEGSLARSTRTGRSLRVADLEDAAQRLLVQLRVGAVALVLVVPVDHVHRAVGAVLEVQHLAPGIVGEQEVGAVRRRVARSRSLQAVHVRPEAVDVVHEDRVAILRRPAVAPEIDHRAGVGVAAAGRARAAVGGVRSLRADPVPVIGDGLDVVVGVRIEVLARLPLVPSALDDVVEVLDDARGREGVAVVVEVEPPRVARALGEDFEDVPGRVIAPDAAVERRAVGVRRAGLADLRVREHAVRAVQPAIGSPAEGVQRLVRVLVAPSVEQHLAAARTADRRRPSSG